MLEKINFIMSGSITGSRGLEAQLVLRKILKTVSNIGRCILVIWEDEARGDMYDAIKRLPVEILVINSPKRQSFGFPERQYKAMVAGIAHFEPDDLIVRLRTDNNIVLESILTLLSKKFSMSYKDMLRGRILSGEASILHPGRGQEFNFAATKRTLSKINWCESYFSEDYNHEEMEPEFRWLGLFYAMQDPLFQHMYENYNVRDVMQHFFNVYYSKGKANPSEFPQIIKYITWRLANLNLEHRLCCLNDGAWNVDPAYLFNYVNSKVSVFHELIPDLRISNQSTMCSLAGLPISPPLWGEYIDEAVDLFAQDKRSPGAAIEQFDQTFDGLALSSNQYFLGASRYVVDGNEQSDFDLFLDELALKSGKNFETFREFPSQLIDTLRKSEGKVLLVLAEHVLAFPHINDQALNRIAAFCVTLIIALAKAGEYEKAYKILSFIITLSNKTEVDGLVSILNNRVLRLLGKRGFTENDMQTRHYLVPDDIMAYDIIYDFYVYLKHVPEKICGSSINYLLKQLKSLLLQ